MTILISLYEYQDLAFSDLPENARSLFEDSNFVNGLTRFISKTKLISTDFQESNSSPISINYKGIHTTSFVGVIKYKNIQIEILPKLLKNSVSQQEEILDKDKQQILKNLLFMLSYTKRLKLKTNELANLSASDNVFLEALIRIFATELFGALKRFLPKSYIHISDNMNFVKGRINIQKNIKHNYANRAKFFCEFDEFSENNPLNQLFLYVASNLNNITRDHTNKKILLSIINNYSEIDFVRFYPKDLIHINLTRNQSIFKTAFILAKMFIEHTSVDMSKNKFDNITLFWDMNKLFEEFVYQVLKNKCDSIEVEFQRHKHLLEDYGRDTSVDIFMSHPRKVIIDTKYKQFKTISDFSNADVFQVSTYCLLHNTKEAILIYPQWENTQTAKINRDCKLNPPEKDTPEKDKRKIKFCTVNLHRDLKTEIDTLAKDLTNILVS